MSPVPPPLMVRQGGGGISGTRGQEGGGKGGV